MVRLPAEWEPQTAVMLTWPHDDTAWAEQLGVVAALYARISALVAARQQVLICCRDRTLCAQVAACLSAAGVAAARIRYAIAPSNDTWTRDHGPITVIDDRGRARLVDFRFNGWGGKYPADLDDRITASLHAAGRFGAAPLAHSRLVLEGGAVDSDGRGALLAVRRTVLDPARNPGWSQAQIEAELRGQLGVTRVLWLGHGLLPGDDTDGHIDTLVRFCDSETICFADATARSQHPDYPELAAMRQELRTLRTADGRPYRLIPLPLPNPTVDENGRPLPASYANFLIINGAVLAPIYADPADAIALRQLRTAFPDRAVLPVDCRPLIRQGGSLHCITMQIPAALTLPAD